MNYNFDKIIDRKNTNSLKHDYNFQIFEREDILSMWVADMDFESPDFIVKAIQQRLNHPIYGYTICPDSLYESIINWIRKIHGWEIKKEWMTFCTGVVPALNFCVMALTNPDDRVIVQPPVYYPFFSAIKYHNREIQNNPLKIINGRFEIDYENLEKNTDKRTKLFFLCSPHNPGGRVWPLKDLKKLAEFCLERNIIIISDEVHSDMVYSPANHIPLASVSKEISETTVTLMAPTKTFNLAGLAFSYIITENIDLLDRLNDYLDKTNVNAINIFAQVAAESAYNLGYEWLQELMLYLKNNFSFLNQFIKDKIPILEVMNPESTYLAWIDFRKLSVDSKELKKFIVTEAGLGLNDGAMFGMGGSGFQRLNFACPREILNQGLTKLYNSIKKLV